MTTANDASPEDGDDGVSEPAGGPQPALLELDPWTTPELAAEAQGSGVRAAVLRYELAQRLEATGDVAGAARELLEAHRAERELLEPLDRLAATLQARRSVDHLIKVLDELASSARQPAEAVRALAAVAWVQLDAPGGSVERAAEAARDAAALLEDDAVSPGLDALVSAARDAAAARSGDAAARADALADRARAATGAWAQALARRSVLARGGAWTEADLELVSRLADTGPLSAPLVALSARLSAELGDSERRAQAEERLAAGDASSGAERLARRARAAALHAQAAQLDFAREVASAALDEDPEHPALLRLAERAAAATGDRALGARVARVLATTASGPRAADARLQLMAAAVEADDAVGALDELDAARVADPLGVAPLAVRLDHASPARLESLEADFEALRSLATSDAARFRVDLARAVQLARWHAAGAHPAELAADAAVRRLPLRVQRMLAAAVGDEAWMEQVLRDLGAACDDEATREVLAAELAAVRGARAPSLAALSATPLEAATPPELLLRAFGVSDSEEALAALARLGELETEPGLRERLAVLAALESGAPSGAPPDGAVDWLDAGLRLAAVRRAGPASVGALRTLAERLDDDGAAEALLEATLRAHAAGDGAAALELGSLAAERSPDAAPLLRWLTAAGESPEPTRPALGGAPPAFMLLYDELFGTNAAATSDVELDDAPPGLALAVRLARALRGTTSSDDRVLLEAEGPWCVAATYLGAADESARREAAETWARAVPFDLAANVAALGEAMAADDLSAEARARGRIADALAGSEATAMHASAAFVERRVGAEARFLRGSSLTARLANLELAGPGEAPLLRSGALLAGHHAFGEEDDAVLDSLAGHCLLAIGEDHHAVRVFRRALRTLPEDLALWEGLRVAALRLGDRAMLAEACSALGDLVADASWGAELWEIAAGIRLDELGEADLGEYALTRAFARDASRGGAFDRLFRLVRGRGDDAQLLELLDSRLEAADDPDELTRLFWERARALRALGRRDEAMEALEHVTMLEPDHVGALALAGEIEITRGAFASAAELLSRLADHPEAPTKQRNMSAVAAADLFDRRLDQPARAVELLDRMLARGEDQLAIHERVARAASRAKDFERAAVALERLATHRPTPDGRAEAAKLLMAIHRDERRDPGKTLEAALLLLRDQPTELEALDTVIAAARQRKEASDDAARVQAALVEQLRQSPLQPQLLDRSAQLASLLGDTLGRQVALSGIVALGQGTGEIELELDLLDQRVARAPRTMLDDTTLASVRAPGDQGDVAELARLAAPTWASVVGPNLGTLGVTRKQRVPPGAASPLRTEIMSWAGALGIGELELYVGGPEPTGVTAVPGDPPALVIGPGVPMPLVPMARQQVARELLALRVGTAVTRRRDPSEVAALVVATCACVGQRPPSPPYALLAEFERLVGRLLPRRVRHDLEQVAMGLVASPVDLEAWAVAATRTLDRMALVASGDLSLVLVEREERRGHVDMAEAARQRAAAVFSFALSPIHGKVRDQLGMGVR